VITAGSWDSTLLPFLNGLAVPERQVLAWLQPERPELFTPEIFPVFNLLVDEGRYYGFPIFGVPGFKFGKYHHFEEQGPPESLNRDVTREDEAMLREFAARYFPEGAGPTMTLKSCMFTNSPDKHFIIDLHPEYPQVSFAAAFTGHGYKFASVIGEIMADLAERGDCRHDIRLFSLARLTGQVSALHARPLGAIQPAGQTASRSGLAAIPPRRAFARPAGNRLVRSLPHPGQSPAYARERLRSPRRSHGEDQGFDYLVDSTDPLYWERDRVEPFWL
jgi:hypothetical protein